MTITPFICAVSGFVSFFFSLDKRQRLGEEILFSGNFSNLKRLYLYRTLWLVHKQCAPQSAHLTYQVVCNLQLHQKQGFQDHWLQRWLIRCRAHWWPLYRDTLKEIFTLWNRKKPHRYYWCLWEEMLCKVDDNKVLLLLIEHKTTTTKWTVNH